MVVFSLQQIHNITKQILKNKLVMNKTITTQKHSEKGLHYSVIWIVQSHSSGSGVKLHQFTF